MSKNYKDLTIVGINDSHDAAACIMRGGRLISAMAEERFQRIKGMGGFPLGAIEGCLKTAGLTKHDIDYVVFGSKHLSLFNLHNCFATLSIADHVRLQEEYWRPILYDGAQIRLRDIFPDYRPAGTLHYPVSDFPLAHNRELSTADIRRIQDMRHDFAAHYFGLPKDRVRFVDHHTAHAYYAYYANPARERLDNMLVLTGDAGGDGAYQTVSVFRNGSFQLLHSDHENILASLYSYATLLLGMRPNEHEYKLMGLAPYAVEYHKKGPREIFRNAVRLNGIAFERNREVRDLYTHFRERLKAHRFDGIAGGVQDFVEHYVAQWMGNATQISGIPDVSYAGGLSLNVKANKRVSEMPEIDSLFIPPGAGDESLPIGACVRLLDELGQAEGINIRSLEPFPGAFLGSRAERRDIAEMIEHPQVRGRYRVIEGVSPRQVAEFLRDGEICALFCDTMEFGPRALGHRSIIADASRPESKTKINDAIKKRDFWMPFAPAVMAERAHDYVHNPKNLVSRYMTLTFDTTPLGRRNLAAALHPVDHTARLQTVDRETSPTLHAVLREFESLTGNAGVLNTSLNIHGKPIVTKPADIATEILSADGVELNVIYVDGTLLTKNSRA